MSSKLIYDSAFWRAVLKGISWLYLKLSGWQIVGTLPAHKKLVIIGAPHTSNWDFPIFLSLAGYLDIRVTYLGKHSLFQGPFSWFFYYMGGIPVDRSSPEARDIVSQVVDEFKARDRIWLGIAPEGTRKRVEKWKTGFYRIAQEAGVPIATAFLDKKTKVIGFGPVFDTTDDMQADLTKIRAVYADKVGVKPENFSG